jgi:hypothetical protein
VGADGYRRAEAGVKSAQKQQIRADFAPRRRKLACAPEV